MHRLDVVVLAWAWGRGRGRGGGWARDWARDWGWDWDRCWDWGWDWGRARDWGWGKRRHVSRTYKRAWMGVRIAKVCLLSGWLCDSGGKGGHIPAEGVHAPP